MLGWLRDTTIAAVYTASTIYQGGIMIQLKSLVAAGALATAALASGMASAADVSQASQTLTFDSGTAYFGHSFTSAAAGDTFADNFSFSGSGVLSSVVSAFTNPSLSDAIQITGFQVINSAGFILSGAKWSEGAFDSWTAASSGSLLNDSYIVKVTGKLLTSAATSYSGSVSVTAVPEPETVAMLVAGLGLIGFAGRRRNKGASKPF
ncbi:PEP-CTERM sorting domain-containing protein [Pseudoduganella sp. FT26W]|uniref:PEP-CTERM sorting domain-containing protein n=1 Tax=Duganella aquatilis TaxID=2666082 RepID=A0A844DEL2_9BURK|nr:FxDxF family PEP-CTERM protein [Duganella aquatilis]MRW86244.1 PEP-CTERM sorting domain-containing protein [Duganella aquatilis]